MDMATQDVLLRSSSTIFVCLFLVSAKFHDPEEKEINFDREVQL